MEILKIIEQLQTYPENVVAHKLDGCFAKAVTEAAELLVSQGERIAEMEEQNRWIPVTERLPEVRVPVLTYGRKGAIGIGFSQPTSVAPDGKIYFYARYGDSLPTHWMPLPEPPGGNVL